MAVPTWGSKHWNPRPDHSVTGNLALAGAPAAGPLASAPTVDGQRLACCPACILARKVEHAVHDVRRSTQAAHRDALDQAALPFLAERVPLPFGRGIAAHETGRDAVDGDAPRP